MRVRVYVYVCIVRVINSYFSLFYPPYCIVYSTLNINSGGAPLYTACPLLYVGVYTCACAYMCARMYTERLFYLFIK